MSLINDALKQARQAQPRTPPSALPPLQPIAEEPSSVGVWLIPAIVIVLIVAAIFFIGWAAAHNSVRTVAAQQDAVNATQQVETVVVPVVSSAPEPPPAPLPPALPRLQGIFYSPTTPTAILDGKTVRPGDKFGDFKVKEISKYTVTLIAADKKEYKVNMGD